MTDVIVLQVHTPGTRRATRGGI